VVNGQVLDPDGNVTTSEGQAYGLLRAVVVDDRVAFHSIYGWSNEHLRNLNNLYSWKLVNGEITDKANATDADEDMAIALLAACKKWQLPEYCEDAQKIMAAIWEMNVGYVNGIPYLLAGDWADRENELVLNPSYLAPAYYRLFAKADSAHDWDGLVTSSYVALKKCTEMTSGALPPEWCALNKKDGSARAVADLPDTSYGFNAFRTPWRVALDYEWFAAEEAVDYLSSLEVLGKAWRENGKVNATYFHDGREKDQYESVAAYLGVYSYFRVINPTESEKIYQEKILSKFYENSDHAYWDVDDNYYTQNLAWFATALYGGQFNELFETLQ
jgi:endoglucanase